MRREAAHGISLQNRQKDAAGSRRHLTHIDNKLLRKGAGGCFQGNGAGLSHRVACTFWELFLAPSNPKGGFPFVFSSMETSTVLPAQGRGGGKGRRDRGLH